MGHKSKFETQLFKPKQTAKKDIPKPPSHLVDLNKSPASNQAVTDGNDKISYLLRMPAEIRLQILKDVLGGNCIHVIPFPTESRRRPKVQVHSKLDASSRSAMTTCRCDPSRDAGKAIDEHHSHAMRGSQPASLNLGVLQVCRRLYVESALLPFKDNTFAVDLIPMEFITPLSATPPRTFQGFLDFLGREQREAVAHVQIEVESCAMEHNKSQIARLTGLRSLHMVSSPKSGRRAAYNAPASNWEHAGGPRRDWRCFRLPVLTSVQLSLGAKLDVAEVSAFVAQTPELSRLLHQVEAKLFCAMTQRPLPKAMGEALKGEKRLEDDREFAQRLRVLKK